MEGPCSCHITQQNIWQAGHSCFLDFNFKVADSSRAISRYVTQCTSSILYKSNLIYLANEEEIIALIRHLGTQSVRSRRLICLSRAYLQEPPSLYDLRSSKYIKMCSPSTLSCTSKAYPATPISHLPGTGRYALDSYRIFCTEKHGLNSEWKTVLPTDKELVRYLVSQSCYSRFWYLSARLAAEMEVGLL